ncbi:MAG: hypothetical protein U1A23_03690, partial [Candidatus Sungbacteria bacterium]|nr:hypothetical protein [Candidatus Sungbacteria bacterium]
MIILFQGIPKKKGGYSMIDELMIENTYINALRVYKPTAGLMTSAERELREKTAKTVIDILRAHANKYIEYGVPEKEAYNLVFISMTTDATLLSMMVHIHNAL